jgi:hypothetical protein
VVLYPAVHVKDPVVYITGVEIYDHIAPEKSVQGVRKVLPQRKEKKEGRTEGRKDGRKDGRTEGRKDGRNERRNEG